MAEDRRFWLDSASALGAVVLWGLAFPLIQTGLEDFSPIMLGFVRFVLASAVLMVAVLLRHSAAEMRSTIAKEWKMLLALGFLYVALPNVAQNIGLQHGTSSIASVIQSSGPVMTLAFAILLLKEELTRAKAVGTLIAMTGTILLVASGGISLDNQEFVDNVLILVSAASYGLAWVAAKRMLERNPPMLIIGLGVALGTLMLGAAVPLESGSEAVYTSNSIANLVVLGVLCAGLSSVLYLRSLEKQDVSRMAFLIYLMPVFASVFAWILRSEGVQSWTVLCGVIIVLGIVIANQTGLPRRRERAGAA